MASRAKRKNLFMCLEPQPQDFSLNFKRNYDFAVTLRKYQILPLVQVNTQYITDTVGNGQLAQDTTARDPLEAVPKIVPAHGRSPNPFDPSVRSLYKHSYHSG
jgi:hypothetical protein